MMLIYLQADGVDVASLIRTINGVQRVTREVGGHWRIVADKDVTAEAARRIIGGGGALTLLVSEQQLEMLRNREAGSA